ncbi:MAG TPA: allantoinase AllB [Pyrinomonadaceae bacterium]|jgi:allantoinase|nr:allantoinase AllB [Pyrinomonadaceae bacterium]
MPTPDLIIRGRTVVSADAIGPASIHIRDEKIVAVRGFDEIVNNCEIVEASGDSIVMPGLVDTHVHINSPGRSEWEGFPSATRAAAAGGVTTLVDMPLNSIPATTTLAAFQTKLEDARDHCFVDVGFWGGVVPGNTAELAPMFAAGVVGFKCFLVPSGVDEFPHVTEEDLREAMPELSRLGAMLIVHAELPGPMRATDSADYEGFLRSRPRAAEDEAVQLMIRLSREFGTRVHIVHLSSADALPLLRAAQNEGVKISAETCPHYLHLAAETIPAGATEFKCCPPIRENENRERLWQGLAEGTIEMIVSDHSPCPASMKLRETGDFMAAWGGIASLQLRLPVVWTEARRRGFSLRELTNWICANPARQVSLESRKGALATGRDADVVIWNPDREFVVEGARLKHRHKLTPYERETLNGVVEKTFLRGRKIYDEEHGPVTNTANTPAGRLLL